VSTIVFCEDDPVIQKLIRIATRSLPHQVHIVADGNAGLTLIEQHVPAAVFTDVSMPGLSGMQLLDVLKQRADLAHIPVVLVTASVQRADMEDGLRRGATDYLSKPFGPAELRAKIEQVLRPPAGASGHPQY
jgi:CheY-like chemotaxis protein